mgnify:CR=1 FL=1
MQLIFFVPGIDETLRVGGKGKLSADPDLLGSMVEFGKPPRAVLRIDVSEAYFHCGKALMRSKLWSADQVERSVMPSISQVIHDQTSLGEPESQDVVYERYKDAAVAAESLIRSIFPVCPGKSARARLRTGCPGHPRLDSFAGARRGWPGQSGHDKINTDVSR